VAEAKPLRVRAESAGKSALATTVVDGVEFRLRTVTIPPLSRARAIRPLAATENLGEREILGYRCRGTRQNVGSTSVERWHSPDLRMDLLTTITNADGSQTIREVIEVIRPQ
jgi:hypothetical protein